MGVRPLNRAVFLDRDGVINRALLRDGRPYPPAALDEVEILPGVDQAIRDLKRAGFHLIVITNQPDVARGTQRRDVVEAINETLVSRLALDDVRVCYHDDGDDCACRKPKDGMLRDAAAAFDIDLSASFVVGDRWRDIAAGKRAGCRTVLVDYGYDEPRRAEPDARVGSLAAAARWILGTLTD